MDQGESQNAVVVGSSGRVTLRIENGVKNWKGCFDTVVMYLQIRTGLGLGFAAADLVADMSFSVVGTEW